MTYVVHLMTNPTKGPNGVYYYVKRVPKDLIAKIGKERYSISLRTKDPKEAKRQNACAGRLTFRRKDPPAGTALRSSA